MSRDYKAVFAKIEAAKPFKEGAKVTHKGDIGTDAEGTIYEITVEQGVGARIWLSPYRSGTPCSFEELELVSTAVSRYQKLSDAFDKLGVNPETTVSLTYEDDVDVIHYTGEAEETAVAETGTVEALVDAARSGIKFQEDLIEDMRDQDHLEDYERGDFDFESYCTEKIVENFYDYYDYIECSTEQYDHKRGNTTVTATLTSTAGCLLANENGVNGLGGWSVEFSTENGNMTIEI
ncbi:MAG: hypothetical protein CMB77_04900 [Euryarchaeota archaeon]|nr:hypothetical protein [Euryarchaeota archaeon]|tara:strand:- start:17 stop:721 length:705 start_codon:yes stop_codon:yes gene_type:complete